MSTRLEGYKYRHSTTRAVQWFDTHAERRLASNTGGIWILVRETQLDKARILRNRRVAERERVVREVANVTRAALISLGAV